MSDPTATEPASPEDDLRRQVLADDTVPEPVRQALERGFPLEAIRLDRNGRWWHRGEIIEHPKIRRLFSRSVERTDGGTWVLHIWRFSYPIIVDDTPYFVRSAQLDDATGEVRLSLNDETVEPLAPGSLRLEGEGRLLARVKDGRYDARFLRRAYHDLVEHLEEGLDGYDLVVGPTRHRIEQPTSSPSKRDREA